MSDSLRSSSGSCSPKFSQASVRSKSSSRSNTRSCSIEKQDKRERARRRSRSRSRSRKDSSPRRRSFRMYQPKSRSRSRSRTRKTRRRRSRSRTRSRSRSKLDRKSRLSSRKKSRSRSKSKSDRKRRSSRSRRRRSSKSKRRSRSNSSRDRKKQSALVNEVVESDSSISIVSNTDIFKSKGEKQKIILVVNVSQHATSKQVESLFAYCGKIKDFVMYPMVDMPIPLFDSKIAFIKFARSSSVRIALHLMSTMFLDRSIFIMKFIDDEIDCSKIPDECEKVVQSLLAGNNTELITKMIKASYQLPNSLSVKRSSDRPHSDRDMEEDRDKNDDGIQEFSVGGTDISTSNCIETIDLTTNENGDIVFNDEKQELSEPVINESEFQLCKTKPEEKSTKLFELYDYKDFPYDFTNSKETN